MKVVAREELIQKCFNCTHFNQDTTSDVSFCNICGELTEDGLYIDCYEPEESEEL